MLHIYKSIQKLKNIEKLILEDHEDMILEIAKFNIQNLKKQTENEIEEELSGMKDQHLISKLNFNNLSLREKTLLKLLD